MNSAKSILLKIFTEYYLSASQAKKEGRPIVWASAFVPVEILRAMDVVCLYPESYAVVCSASGKAPSMIHASETAAFAQDLCSYSLIAFGMEHTDRLPYGGLPQPDLLVASNNQCGTIPLWFRLLSQKLNIPLFILDYPAADDQPSIQNYIQSQQQSLIKFLSQYTGGRLDPDRLSELIKFSRRASSLWRQIHELNHENPPRLEAARIVDALFPMVVARGTQSACDYYQALLAECRTSQPSGGSPSMRLLWHGYPLWFLSGRFPRCFDDQFRIILNDYTLWWNLDYPDQSDDWQALTSAYSNTGLNWTLEKKIKAMLDLLDQYSIDGVICHANRSCRRSLADIVPIRELLSEKKIPSLLIESDMADPDAYSAEQIRLRIESFREMMEVR